MCDDDYFNATAPDIPGADVPLPPDSDSDAAPVKRTTVSFFDSQSRPLLVGFSNFGAWHEAMRASCAVEAQQEDSEQDFVPFVDGFDFGGDSCSDF